MLDHMTFRVSDMARTKAFDALLEITDTTRLWR